MTWKVQRTWNKHAERIPDRWTWDILDDAGVIASLPEDDPVEAEANARLMARAPELYEGLVGMRDRLRTAKANLGLMLNASPDNARLRGKIQGIDLALDYLRSIDIEEVDTDV